MKQRAIELFESNLSCAQSVFAAYAPEFGIDEKTAAKISCAFGGGMARLADVCGAVTGAFMIIGLRYGGSEPQSKEKTYLLAREFASHFKSLNGSIYCKELLGCDISNAEELELARRKNLFKTLCPKYVRDSCEILESLLQSQSHR
ncbi:C-GCAxxG-C-C family protein [Pseudothermotoga sp. U03pept]|uniref:C-GCAxxG-C-C family protein n=1 Tax=Pseudothermotoga sp. U03pept TaxID=3447012 RepID=UPI003F1151C6